MNPFIIFIIALLAPLVYWRSLFYALSHTFDKPFTRTRTGLQVHHIHYGIIFILIGTLVLLFNGSSDTVIILLGLGLGLMLDELIPSLLIPGNRPLELEVYKSSFSATFMLFLGIVFLVLILGFI
ncbi:MAG: hypothetical protein UW97_C0016G0001 [Parcubacteria group bacterium GW2011_GWA2_45_15]|nr:MAG: hypothetical protein UW97_C0016G0001 [Parcubacteria group bacterium GW2011_GWA2_45_15]